MKKKDKVPLILIFSMMKVGKLVLCDKRRHFKCYSKKYPISQLRKCFVKVTI